MRRNHSAMNLKKKITVTTVLKFTSVMLCITMPILTLFAPFKNFFYLASLHCIHCHIPNLTVLYLREKLTAFSLNFLVELTRNQKRDSNYYRLPLYFPVSLRCLLFVPGEKWPTSLGLVVKQVIQQKEVWRACPMNFESN